MTVPLAPIRLFDRYLPRHLSDSQIDQFNQRGIPATQNFRTAYPD